MVIRFSRTWDVPGDRHSGAMRHTPGWRGRFEGGRKECGGGLSRSACHPDGAALRQTIHRGSLSLPSIPSVFLFHLVLISLSVSVPLLFFAYYLNISIILSVLIWNKTRLPALAQNQHTRGLINAQKTPHQHPGCTSGISEGFQKVCIPYIYTHAWCELL